MNTHESPEHVAIELSQYFILWISTHICFNQIQNASSPLNQGSQ